MEKSFEITRHKNAVFALLILLVIIAAALIFAREQALVPVTGGVSEERAVPVKLSAPSSGPNPVYEYNLSRIPNVKIQSGPNPVYEYNLSRPPASVSPHKTDIGGGFWLKTYPDGTTIIER